MPKKIALLFTTLVFTFSMAFSALAQTFPDVAESTRYYGAVEYLKEKGVISGYPDGTFKPDQPINRAEALKIAMTASAAQTDVLAPTQFPDVQPGQWFYDPVQKAISLGIVEGYDDGTFKPANNINIAESLKIVFLSFRVEVGAAPEGDPYPDVDQTAWYSAYAQYAKDHQFVDPEGDGLLHGGKDITRGQFADIIYRLMYTEEKGLDKFPLSTNWPTFVHSTDHYSVKYPFGWQQVDAGGQTILWKEDTEHNQLSWARLFPNSATMVIAVDKNENGLSLDSYFGLIEYDSSASIQSQDLNGYPFKSVYVADTSTFDYYFGLPNGSILVIYSQVGEGLNKPQLIEEIRNIVGSVRYSEGSKVPVTSSSQNPGSTVTDEEKFLADVRAQILVEGQAEATLALFSDAVLIETDSIGIGTGPVDYYYSEAYNVTLKVERGSNTILAITEQKSTAF